MKDERFYLWHTREAIDDSEAYASAGRDAFTAERMRQDAVIRKLVIIGEAVKKLSDATRQRRADIPWKQIAGMRDRLTHDYFGVDLGLVWRLAEKNLLVLRTTRLMRLLADTLPDATGTPGD